MMVYLSSYLFSFDFFPEMFFSGIASSFLINGLDTWWKIADGGRELFGNREIQPKKTAKQIV